MGDFLATAKMLLDGRCQRPFRTRPPAALAKHGGRHEVRDVPAPEKLVLQGSDGLAAKGVMPPINPRENTPAG